MNNFYLPTQKEQLLYDTILNNRKIISLNNIKEIANNEKLLTYIFTKGVINLPYELKFNLLKQIITNETLNHIISFYVLKNVKVELFSNDIKSIINFINSTFNKFHNFLQNDFILNKWKKIIPDKKYFVFYNIINTNLLNFTYNEEYINLFKHFFKKNLNGIKLLIERKNIKRDKISYVFFIFIYQDF